MGSLKGVANSLRETLKTLRYFDRVGEIASLMEQFAQSPNDALSELIERLQAAPVRSHDKVRIVNVQNDKGRVTDSYIEIRPYGGTDDLDANRFANWASYNTLAERLRLVGYVAYNQQDGRIVVYGRQFFPMLKV